MKSNAEKRNVSLRLDDKHHSNGISRPRINKIGEDLDPRGFLSTGKRGGNLQFRFRCCYPYRSFLDRKKSWPKRHISFSLNFLPRNFEILFPFHSIPLEGLYSTVVLNFEHPAFLFFSLISFFFFYFAFVVVFVCVCYFAEPFISAC